MLDEHAPGAMKAFWEFDKQAFAGGALSERDKQRIGVGVALTTQCPYYAKARGPVSDAAWAGRGRSEVSRSAPRATGARSGGYPSHF